MRTTHLRILAVCVLTLMVAGSAFAAGVEKSIMGRGGENPIGGVGIDVTQLGACGSSTGISRGLGAYGDGPWTVAQSFVASASGTPAAVGCGLSYNGFPRSCTLIVSIFNADAAGHPTGSAIASGQRAVSGLPGYPSAKRTIVPVSGGSLVAGNSYCVVWGTVPGSGACFVDGSSDDVCSNGHASQSLDGGVTYADDVDSNDGSSTDIYFAVVMP
jgi:hypothetical protein